MDDRLMRATHAVDEYHWWYRGRRRIIEVELARLGLGGDCRVLDAGCGSGRTLLELERYGHVSGLELDPAAAEIAKARGPFDVRVGRLETLPWADASFDLVTCLDVIEHTENDHATLLELARVTRPGGWLLVTVPAYEALWSQHDEDNHHFRRYGRGPLRRAAVRAGWEVTRMTSFNSLLLAPAAVVRLAQRRQRPVAHKDDAYRANVDIGPAWLNGVLERPMRAEARWLARGRTLPAGLSLLTVLRRPDLPSPVAGGLPVIDAADTSIGEIAGETAATGS